MIFIERIATDELLIKSRDLASFQHPSDRDYMSVRNWIYKYKPVVLKEQKFIKHKEDILTLHSGREWCSFDVWVESLLWKLDCRLIRVSSSCIEACPQIKTDKP